MEYGVTYWSHLPPDIMTDEVKAFVTQDPDVSDITLQRILEAQPPKGGFSFDFSASQGNLSCGYATLSMCIKESNALASMGELIARYAEAREIPYSDCAVALTALRKKNALYYTVWNKKNRRWESRTWTPFSEKAQLPPGKRKQTATPVPLPEIKPIHPKGVLCKGNMSTEEYFAKKQAGILRAAAEGRVRGRKKLPRPPELDDIRRRWLNGEITTANAAKQLSISAQTFRNWMREAAKNKADD